MKMFAGKTFIALVATSLSQGLVACDSDSDATAKLALTPNVAESLALGETMSYELSVTDHPAPN